MQVIEIEIKKIAKAPARRREVYMTLDESAKKFLVEKGFQPEMGARPLRRTIEQYLEDPLAEKLLMHPDEGTPLLSHGGRGPLGLCRSGSDPLRRKNAAAMRSRKKTQSHSQSLKTRSDRKR